MPLGPKVQRREYWRDLKISVRSQSTSLKIAAFSRSHTISHCLSILWPYLVLFPRYGETLVENHDIFILSAIGPRVRAQV